MKIIIISISFLLFLGCAYNTGAVQRAEKSSLQFTGNSEGVSVVIDNNSSFQLSTTEGSLYQLNHGKHTIKIYRNNKLIVDRIIFLEDHGIMEIIIP